MQGCRAIPHLPRFYLLRAQVLEVSRCCLGRNPERALTQVTERLAHRESLGGTALTRMSQVMPLGHWPGALLTRRRRVPQSVLQRVRQNLDLAHGAFNYIARLRGSRAALPSSGFSSSRTCPSLSFSSGPWDHRTT